MRTTKGTYSLYLIGILIAAWFFCMGTQTCLLLGMTHGAIGRHAWEISIEKYGFYSRVRVYVMSVEESH